MGCVSPSRTQRICKPPRPQNGSGLLRLVIAALAAGKSARAVEFLFVNAARLMKRLPVATLTRLLFVGACHSQMLARRSSGLTHTSRRCRMMPEVGHAPATIETGLCCYDCFLRELPAGAASSRTGRHMDVVNGSSVVECLRCGQHFEVMLPDAIIGGPFLPRDISSAQ